MNEEEKAKSKKIALLLKLDSTHLFERITERKKEYINIYALKRTREHFKEIFFSRFKTISMNDLVYFGQDTIIAIDNFYSCVDKLEWYLSCTEDLPQTLDDYLVKEIKTLRSQYETLSLFLNSELEIISEAS